MSELEDRDPTTPAGRTPRSVLVGIALAVAMSAALPACHSTLSPERIDQIQRWCGAHPFDPSRPSSRSIAFRPNAKPAGTPVVIYGAQWCPACGATTDYLTRRQIPYVEEDIEHADGADVAMRATLAAAGLEESDTVPVIDARGTITVGFFPCVLEAAWAAR
jgi:glutaredoxin